MQEIAELITNNGLSVVCVAFMIYFINTTLKDNNKILDEVQKTLVSIQEILSNLVTRVDELEKKNNKKKVKKEGE